jgi:hypothetical protein
MMRRILATATIALLAGCAGGPAAAPGGSSALPQSEAKPAAQSKIPGQYAGTGDDVKLGTTKAAADLSQAGNAIGGSLQLKFPAPDAMHGAVAMNAKQNSLSGFWTATVGTATCTFAVSATYDPTAYTLDGKYTAKRNCSGDSGTFALKERCYYVDGLRAHLLDSARPAAGGVKPC